MPGPRNVVLELTRALVAYDTINPPGFERDCADHLAGLLEAGGFRVDKRPFADGRTSLVARIAGRDEAHLPLCLTGHIDTVPLGARAWHRDPFAGETADGRLYGRGTTDMKGGVAALVLAALDLADEARAGPGLEVVLTAGEETGCEGAAHLVESGALGRAGAIVVGEPTALRPVIGHKGALWLSAVATGVTAHAATPELGVNAVYKAARAISTLEQFGFNVAPHALLGAPTLNVGTVRGGLNFNSVPDRAEVGIDIRTIPGQRHDMLIDDLRRILGEEVALEPVIDVEGVATDPAHPWVRRCCEIMAGHLGHAVEPAGAPYFTDAALLTPAYGGPPTVILGPGEPELAHQTDEYCRIDRLELAPAAYADIARAWFAGGD